MSEIAWWSMAMASASSAVLRRGHSDDELELRLYLGLKGDARGSAGWSEAWQSCVRELSKNGATRERGRSMRVRASDKGGHVATVLLPTSA